MKKPMLAAQMFTVRDFTKTPEGIDQSLKKIRDIGYNAVQVSAIGDMDHQELKDLTDKYDLKICATHIGYDRLINNLDDVINQHKIWNCKYVGLGAMPGEFRTSKAGYKDFAREATDIARKLDNEGLRFIYHNHDFEFMKFDGITGMDILFNETDPEVFGFEIDTFWIQAGGANPLDWIKKVRGRMDVVHYKDMGINNDGQRMMTEVGEGNINWPAIINACIETEVKWAAVEQDICQGDPFESLAISLKNLRDMGLND